ncbi:hypothetical protein GPECTOR_91g571 [Gonium pectorale]|uniref:Uncharacterized protein n=1 Tax=Gonium pectorale TaxID=33097 RepID=A0A150G0Q9_GONPE|nr:hypothetical protein GPECTOR_91g571 [Gonium pectorale]|eukprot:KXZ43417.1 hypothetical protein GPECTOR_91g571 [Gonium pectorale]
MLNQLITQPRGPRRGAAEQQRAPATEPPAGPEDDDRTAAATAAAASRTPATRPRSGPPPRPARVTAVAIAIAVAIVAAALSGASLWRTERSQRVQLAAVADRLAAAEETLAALHGQELTGMATLQAAAEEKERTMERSRDEQRERLAAILKRLEAAEGALGDVRRQLAAACPAASSGAGPCPRAGWVLPAPASSPSAPLLRPGRLPQPSRPRPGSLAPCRATLDSPEIAVLVDQMLAARPPPGPRDMLKKCVAAIDELNAKDPSQVEFEGRRHPYRLLYSVWLTDWVAKLDPGAPDELFILARGKAVESWRLVEIKRDDYSPNSIGQKQWEVDRKAWLANRLKGVMKEAGYSDASCSLVEDFMLGRDLPDPRDVRLYDVTGPMGAINFRLLELLRMVQTLRDAEALLFLERTFPKMFEAMPADDVLAAVRRELGGVSKKCLAAALQQPWPPLQKKLLARALPAPPGWGDVLRELEGVAAASSHPGDWRYRDFDYE